MSQPVARMGWSIWIGIIGLVFLLTLALLLEQFQKANSTQPSLPILNPVAEFALTNQGGQAVTLADLRGHVWIADIIFTRCPGPCLLMSRQMKELQDALPAESNARLVSLTTDADFDTPPILQKYAERFSADSNRWIFLTGNKTNVANLAIDSLKLTAIAKKPEERTSANDLFVHSTIFVIIDKQARLRGVYQTEGEDVNWSKMKAKILSDARQLGQEP